MTEPSTYFDRDGRLIVRNARISATGVNTYRGSELPPYRTISPRETFRVFRSGPELEKAAPSFCNVPVLRDHPEFRGQRDGLVVGVTGDSARFDGKYIVVDMIIFDADAIEDILSGHKRELSAAYNFDVDCQSGVAADHGRFDLAMKHLAGDHVALVTRTRAGRGCAIPSIYERTFGYKPMPSPNHTNFERLFIYRGPGPQLAYDAMPSTLDQAHGSKRVKMLAEWCSKNLADHERVALVEKLTGELENTPTSRAAPAKQQAMDSSSRNFGRPGVLTSASEIGKLAAKIKIDTTGVQPTKPAPRPNANAVANFNARFPQAAKIKVL